MGKENFDVVTYSVIDLNNEGGSIYVHWSKGLKMIITKGEQTIKLDENDIEKLVQSLPRTIGGGY